MTTPQHCPGWEQFKDLKAFTCKCPRCGKEKEIFSDEFDREHTCKGCGEKIDFTQCSIEAEGKSKGIR
ncbi:MAG: hypothetical protein JSV50_20390 [Desulfobacteraceae bacterium]|jgi:uncharacterized protein (DUF983 family)|nr:MAG: hypothetical protein JSV50_20390 [Desulfobacteraceae bacterium]